MNMQKVGEPILKQKIGKRFLEVALVDYISEPPPCTKWASLWRLLSIL